MTLRNSSETRKQFSDDAHRPQYHFIPPTNWMNDPNGLIQWKGIYHLFYQHNPLGPLWGNMSWGHAISDDLIHWKDLPLALEPTENSYDAGGCFSGCTVDNEGTPIIFYTATPDVQHQTQMQSMATGDDELINWTKHPDNPIIRQIPPQTGQKDDFRDPFVWQEKNTWYMLIGSRIQNVGGAVLLYRSKDLVHWEYLNPVLINANRDPRTTWECPNFFRLGDKWILIISEQTGSEASSKAYYFVGEYQNQKFIPELSDVLDYGLSFAPLTFEDDNNRRIMFAWIREARSDFEQRIAGWSGVQSIPRILALDANNRLLTTPVPELKAIRGRQYNLVPQEIVDEPTLEIESLQLDIVADFSLHSGGNCCLSLAYSSIHHEKLAVIYDSKNNRLTIQQVTQETTGALVTRIQEIPHLLSKDESLKLRILLDHSVVEIIANKRTSVTCRIYPTKSGTCRIKVSGQNSKLDELNVWELASIWH